MRIFSSLSERTRTEDETTADFYIGAPEAEAETTTQSRIQLGTVFNDFLGVLPELGHEKFIVLGRKGSGKTAIAEYAYHLAQDDPNTFCEFVRHSDLALERIIQLEPGEGSPGERDGEAARRAELLFEWIILIKLTKLITQNEAVQNHPDYKNLAQFVRKNTGYVDIKDYQLQEYVEGRGLELDITYFKRFFKSRFKRSTGIKAQKAPFYKLMPHLKETVQTLLSSPEDALQGNEYVLMFDDLDIGFKAYDRERLHLLVALLRIAKDYNVNVFGKSGIGAKVLIFLRDDLARVIATDQADTAKLFSSYSVTLSWYEQVDYNADENRVRLKQFINRRIRHNFEETAIPMRGADPWSSLIVNYDTEHYGPRSSFKYVLDHTFYRPRDFILFFKPLAERAFKIPIRPREVDELLVLYSDELVNEVKNELAASYDPPDVAAIFEALRHLVQSGPFLDYNQIRRALTEASIAAPRPVIQDLFDYSLIGNVGPQNHVRFKHRERRGEVYEMNADWQFLIHYPIEVHFKRGVRLGQIG
jgi:hypothetical protein